MTSETAALPMKKRIERLAGRAGLRITVGPLRALPMPAARAMGRGVGMALYLFLGRYRRTALKNLKLVYGDALDDRARKKLARSIFLHFGQAAAEFVKMPRMGREELDQLIQVEGEENLHKALAMGKGALVITGHFGNWEFLNPWFAAHGHVLNVVARKANDPEAEKLLRDTRTGSGSQVFNRGDSARPVLQSLKRGEPVAILIDQNAGNIVAPFFGMPTGTTHGPAALHLHSGSPLLFTWCFREPDGRFTLVFEPPEVYAPTGDKEADIVAIMTLANARLEAQIRRHPEQWLWLHDRWRASPWVFEKNEGEK